MDRLRRSSVLLKGVNELARSLILRLCKYLLFLKVENKMNKLS